MDGVIGSFLTARNALPPIGKWEADIEAVKLFNLAIRDIESIIELAKADLVLLPGANVLARAVFEISLKAAWMVQPDDPFQREVRWLVHLKEEARMFKQLVPKIVKAGGDPKFFQERGDLLHKFHADVAGTLPAGCLELPGNPSIEQMLENVGQRQIYLLYTQLSTFVHGGHASTWLYRRHLGTSKEHGEFVSSEDWHLPLWTSWMCLQVWGQFVLDRLKTPTAEFISPEQRIQIKQAFGDLLDHSPGGG